MTEPLSKLHEQYAKLALSMYTEKFNTVSIREVNWLFYALMTSCDPHADHVIFSKDVLSEDKFSRDHMKLFKAFHATHGFPLIIGSASNARFKKRYEDLDLPNGLFEEAQFFAGLDRYVKNITFPRGRNRGWLYYETENSGVYMDVIKIFTSCYYDELKNIILPTYKALDREENPRVKELMQQAIGLTEKIASHNVSLGWNVSEVFQRMLHLSADIAYEEETPIREEREKQRKKAEAMESSVTPQYSTRRSPSPARVRLPNW